MDLNLFRDSYNYDGNYNKLLAGNGDEITDPSGRPQWYSGGTGASITHSSNLVFTQKCIIFKARINNVSMPEFVLSFGIAIFTGQL